MNKLQLWWLARRYGADSPPLTILPTIDMPLSKIDYKRVRFACELYKTGNARIREAVKRAIGK